MNSIPYQSIPEVIKSAAKKYSTQSAVSYKKDGKFVTLNYESLYQRVLMAARGLRKAGLQPGGKAQCQARRRSFQKIELAG